MPSAHSASSSAGGEAGLHAQRDQVRVDPIAVVHIPWDVYRLGVNDGSSRTGEGGVPANRLQTLSTASSASAVELASLMGSMESMANLLPLGRVYKREFQRDSGSLFSM